MADQEGEIIHLNLEDDGTVTISENKESEEDDLVSGDGVNEDVVMETVMEHAPHVIEHEAVTMETLPSSVEDITTEVEHVEEQVQHVVHATAVTSPADKVDPYDAANAEKITSLDTDVTNGSTTEEAKNDLDTSMPFLIEDVCSLAPSGGDLQNDNEQDDCTMTPEAEDSNGNEDVATTNTLPDGNHAGQIHSAASSFTTILPEQQQKQDPTQKTNSPLQLNLVILDLSEYKEITDEVAGVMKKVNVSMNSVLGFVTMYYCNYCSYNSANRNVFISHVVRHLFVCKKCNFQSFSRIRVLEHESLQHDNSAAKTSGIADFVVLGLASNSTKQDKTNTKTGGLSPDQLFFGNFLPNDIISSFGMGNRYFCHHCPFRTTERLNMESHVLVHLGLWECRLCGGTFTRVSTLILHLELQCDISSKPDLEYHVIRRVLPKPDDIGDIIKPLVQHSAVEGRFSLENIHIGMQRTSVMSSQYYDIVRDYRHLAVFDKHVFVNPTLDGDDVNTMTTPNRDVIYRCSACSQESRVPSHLLTHAMHVHGSLCSHVIRRSVCTRNEVDLLHDRSVCGLVHPNLTFTPDVCSLLDALPPVDD